MLRFLTKLASAAHSTSGSESPQEFFLLDSPLTTTCKPGLKTHTQPPPPRPPSYRGVLTSQLNPHGSVKCRCIVSKLLAGCYFIWAPIGHHFTVLFICLYCGKPCIHANFIKSCPYNYGSSAYPHEFRINSVGFSYLIRCQNFLRNSLGDNRSSGEQDGAVRIV